jgi:hypothetical protein
VKDEQSPFLTLKDLARYLGKTRNTIKGWVDRGGIPKHCYVQQEAGCRRMFLRIAAQFFAAKGRWPRDENEQAEFFQSMEAAKLKAAS